LYQNFPLVISERWQAEVAETVFDTVNQEADKLEAKRKAKHRRFDVDEKDSDCILHGYIKKLGGPFASAWQTRYAKLYPNRLELHFESSNSKPELVLMDHIEEVNSDLTTCKGEQSIVLRTREGGRVVLTNQDEIGLKEWLTSLKTAHKCSLELLANMARKAGKIYGTDLDSNNLYHNSPVASRSANGN